MTTATLPKNKKLTKAEQLALAEQEEAQQDRREGLRNARQIALQVFGEDVAAALTFDIYDLMVDAVDEDGDFDQIDFESKLELSKNNCRDLLSSTDPKLVLETYDRVFVEPDMDDDDEDEDEDEDDNDE